MANPPTMRCRRLLATCGSAFALALVATPLAAQVPDEAVAAATVSTAPAYGAVEYEWNDPLRVVPSRCACTCRRPSSRAHAFRWWCSRTQASAARGALQLPRQPLRRHGVASLHVQHVGSDRAIWIGNPFALVGRLHATAQDAKPSIRVLDLRFALDHLLPANTPAASMPPR